MKPIIEVNKVSKSYRYGESQSYYTLRDTITNLFKSPFKHLNNKSCIGKDEFWALKNISFKVNRGDVLGIVGANGSGKSTVLKILSRITPPTGGEAILRGKVGSLLEVGTGFQQELTGRENIFLNGAILGMHQKEIIRKFDEIVDFSGVEKFLDTPVKHYSSGMYMRLAFAVAAHLESEILLVDEVLAVGDAEFQKKCLGKMDDISKNQGRTILFVSHNMSAVEKLCGSVLLIEKGEIVDKGPSKEIINLYQEKMMIKKILNPNPVRSTDKKIIISNFRWINKKGNSTHEFNSGESIEWKFELQSKKKLDNINIVLALEDSSGCRILAATSSQSLTFDNTAIGKSVVSGKITSIILNPGYYNCSLGIRENDNTVIYEPNFCSLNIIESGNFVGQNGIVRINSLWRKIN